MAKNIIYFGMAVVTLFILSCKDEVGVNTTTNPPPGPTPPPGGTQQANPIEGTWALHSFVKEGPGLSNPTVFYDFTEDEGALLEFKKRQAIEVDLDDESVVCGVENYEVKNNVLSRSGGTCSASSTAISKLDKNQLILKSTNDNRVFFTRDYRRITREQFDATTDRNSITIPAFSETLWRGLMD